VVSLGITDTGVQGSVIITKEEFGGNGGWKDFFGEYPM
jgi:hypothetical protein